MMEEAVQWDAQDRSAVLLVTDQVSTAGLEGAFQEYAALMTAEGHQVFPVNWSGGTPAQLRALIGSYRERANAVFLVGDLPVVWYEMTSFGSYEVFPVDLYYASLDSTWSDSDGDGYLDSHSQARIDIPVSRLTGTPDEMTAYFSKLLAYRRGERSLSRKAFIFKDDDWFHNFRGSVFGLDAFLSDIDTYSNESTTVKAAYRRRLSDSDAAYVYQWVHALPSVLFFREGDTYNTMSVSEIDDYNHRGNSYNLFNCQGARYTEENLGSGYLFHTDTALAVMGSTKVGGNYYPMEFHRTLAAGAPWGISFQNWYNRFGYSDDGWFLGMVIMGDPAFSLLESQPRVSASARRLSDLVPPDEEEKRELFQTLRKLDQYRDALDNHPPPQ